MIPALRHSHKADAAILLLYGVLSERSSYGDVVLGFSTTPYTVPDGACFTCSATLFTAFATSVLLLFAKTGCGGSYYHHQRNHNLLHTLLYIKRVILHVPRSTNHSFLSLPDYERKSKKIISISQISKPTLYEMPFCMYQMTKRRRHKSKLQLVHNSWPTHAHHLLCKRISAAMQAHNSCCATGDTN
mgnify:CR=1 FL=1